MKLHTLALALSSTLCLLAAACGSEPEDADRAADVQAAPRRSSNIVHVPLFIKDASGATPTDPAALLYEVRLGKPVLAPDGHQLTLAEFNAPQGTASVKCVPQGTHVTLQLTGLIPNGLYTLWNVVFEAPGFDPTLAHLIGLGAAGSPDWNHNILREQIAKIQPSAIRARSVPGMVQSVNKRQEPAARHGTVRQPYAAAC